MDKENSIKLFEEKRVRVVWNEEQENSPVMAWVLAVGQDGKSIE
jgi:hypothetical protein